MGKIACGFAVIKPRPAVAVDVAFAFYIKRLLVIGHFFDIILIEDDIQRETGVVC